MAEGEQQEEQHDRQFGGRWCSGCRSGHCASAARRAKRKAICSLPEKVKFCASTSSKQ
jgi:hypothetical protein